MAKNISTIQINGETYNITIKGLEERLTQIENKLSSLESDKISTTDVEDAFSKVLGVDGDVLKLNNRVLGGEMPPFGGD